MNAGGHVPIRLKSLVTIPLLGGCTLNGGGDKVAHAVVGAAVSTYVEEHTGSRWKGCAAALGVGLAKEAIDATRGGKGDSDDVAATTLGCAVVWVF